MDDPLIIEIENNRKHQNNLKSENFVTSKDHISCLVISRNDSPNTSPKIDRSNAFHRGF